MEVPGVTFTRQRRSLLQGLELLCCAASGREAAADISQACLRPAAAAARPHRSGRTPTSLPPCWICAPPDSRARIPARAHAAVIWSSLHEMSRQKRRQGNSTDDAKCSIHKGRKEHHYGNRFFSEWQVICQL